MRLQKTPEEIQARRDAALARARAKIEAMQKTCLHCGSHFVPKGKEPYRASLVVFCSRSCAAAGSKDQHPLADEFVRLWKEGKKPKHIARDACVSLTCVINHLEPYGYVKTKTGVKRTDGMGHRGLIEKKQKLRKMLQGATRLKAAKCLKEFRNGVPIETTCRLNGFDSTKIWNVLVKSRGYKMMTFKRGVKREYLVDWKRLKSMSLIFKNEKEMQDSFASFLAKTGTGFGREVVNMSSKSRVDFMVGNTAYELKVETRNMDRCVGQCCLLSLIEKRNVVVVIPSDCVMRKDHVEVLEKINACVMTFDGVSLCKLETHNTRNGTRGWKMCKSCLTYAKPSRGPSGDARSYCVNCADSIGEKEYDHQSDRWIQSGRNAKAQPLLFG